MRMVVGLTIVHDRIAPPSPSYRSVTGPAISLRMPSKLAASGVRLAIDAKDLVEHPGRTQAIFEAIEGADADLYERMNETKSGRAAA